MNRTDADQSGKDTDQKQNQDLSFEVDPDNIQSMLININEQSLAFFRNLSADKKHENIAFSPASLNMAMAVAYSGAREQTLAEISRAMGFDPRHNVFHPLYHEYFTELMNIANDTLVEFSLANRVFLEKTFPVRPSFREDVQQWHGGAFETMDFINNPALAERTINRWVEEITRQRISNLIPPGTLDAMTRLVLVNAIYIKSSWKYPFDKDRSVEKDFTTTTGEKVPATFMIQRQDRISYYEGNNFTAIELPYTTPEFSIVIIRPDERLVSNIAAYIPDAKTYNEILSGFRQEMVYMEIPVFKIESAFSLNSHLQNAGIKLAFSDDADFSGISENRDLKISDVFQKVFFEVDEEGSEAAAATGMVMVTTSMPIEMEEPKDFIADRPFVFILKENRFNTPLFTGQYVK